MTTVVVTVTAGLATWSSANPWRGRDRHGDDSACALTMQRSTRNVTLPREPGVAVARYVVGVAPVGTSRGRGSFDAVLDVDGLPTGITARVEPRRVVLELGHRDASATVALTVARDVKTGTYAFRVRARCGRKDAHVHGTVTVLPRREPPAPGVLTVDPAETTVETGGSVRFCAGAAGQVPPPPYRVKGLPDGVTAQVLTAQRGNGCVAIVVRVGAATTPGDYTITVVSGGHAKPHSHPVRAGTALLHVTGDDGLRFTITGDLADKLYPGATFPLDLTVTNPQSRPIQVAGLGVNIDQLDDAHSSCVLTDNYAVTQFSGDYAAVLVPAGQSRSLSQLGIPPTAWPQLSMLETDADQTPCLGATLTLAYTGTGTGL